MGFFVTHPSNWIGVPEHWPYPWREGEVESPQVWVELLLDECSPGIHPDQLEGVRSTLLLAAQQALRAGGRTYVLFESWSGPVHIAQLIVESAQRLGTRTLAEYAGVDDPDQVGAPFAEEFETATRLQGVRCYRYLRYDAAPATIFGLSTYAFEAGGSIATLTAASIDLVVFERLKAELEPLAASVSWQQST